MITPLDIENKEFSKAMRGYNAEEVDAFLDQIILDLQQLLSEKERLAAEVEELKKDISQYKRSETSVLNTLESAKKLMNDISESAEKRGGNHHPQCADGCRIYPERGQRVCFPADRRRRTAQEKGAFLPGKIPSAAGG